MRWITIGLVGVCGCTPMEYALTGLLGSALQDVVAGVIGLLTTPPA